MEFIIKGFVKIIKKMKLRNYFNIILNSAQTNLFIVRKKTFSQIFSGTL